MSSIGYRTLQSRLLTENPKESTCDACKLDGKISEGKFYCHDCKDYMCGECQFYHSKVKATRFHKVLVVKRDFMKSPVCENVNSSLAKPKKSYRSREDKKAKSRSAFYSPVFNGQHSPLDFRLNDLLSPPSDGFSSRLTNRTPSVKRPQKKIGSIFLKGTVLPQATINIKHPSDEYEPLVKGLAFLERGELLVADYNNHKIKLLECSLKPKTALGCQGAPYDVAVISDNEAVVTLPDQQKLLFVKIVFPFLQCSKTVRLKNDCRGVDVSENNIFVACSFGDDKPEVIILDLSGRVQRVIDIQRIAYDFGDLSHIAINPKGTKMYITGYNQMMCLTMEGEIVFICDEPDRGMIADEDDSAICCSCYTCQILVIDQNGTKDKAVISCRDGLLNPYSIAYRDRDGVLVIGGYLNELCVFKIRKDLQTK